MNEANPLTFMTKTNEIFLTIIFISKSLHSTVMQHSEYHSNLSHISVFLHKNTLINNK